MRSGWIRNEPGPRESVLAGLVALGAGAALAGATFYLTRLLLAREPLALRPADENEEEDQPGPALTSGEAGA